MAHHQISNTEINRINDDNDWESKITILLRSQSYSLVSVHTLLCQADSSDVCWTDDLSFGNRLT